MNFMNISETIQQLSIGLYRVCSVFQNVFSLRDIANFGFRSASGAHAYFGHQIEGKSIKIHLQITAFHSLLFGFCRRSFISSRSSCRDFRHGPIHPRLFCLLDSIFIKLVHVILVLQTRQKVEKFDANLDGHREILSTAWWQKLSRSPVEFETTCDCIDFNE